METSKAYCFNAYAPYLHLNSTGYYLAAHTQLISHAKAYRLYEKEFKSKQQGTYDIQMCLVTFIFFLILYI